MEETKKEMSNLARVLRYLRMQGKIKSDKNFADMVGTTITTVSRNKNSGKPFDEKIMRGVYKAFGDIINLDYLRGESDIMLVKDLPSSKEEANASSQEITSLHSDCNDLVNVAIAAKDEIIASLKREMAANAKTLSAKDEIIAELRARLDDKEALIAELRQQIARNKESKH